VPQVVYIYFILEVDQYAAVLEFCYLKIYHCRVTNLKVLRNVGSLLKRRG